jgi:ribonuclease J
VLVDGNVLWDVGQALLRDRQKLSRDGVVTTVLLLDDQWNILYGPEVVSKGFIYVSDADLILDEGKRRVVEVIDSYREKGARDPERLRRAITEALSRFFSERTRRKPVQMLVLDFESRPAALPEPQPQPQPQPEGQAL